MSFACCCSRYMLKRYFVTAISSSACYKNLRRTGSWLRFRYFASEISFWACSRNLVTVVSLD